MTAYIPLAWLVRPVHMVAAVGVLFLASALAVSSATLALIRRHARTSLTLLLLLAMPALICATRMHLLPVHSPPSPPAAL